jgi:hypothetical protein
MKSLFGNVKYKKRYLIDRVIGLDKYEQADLALRAQIVEQQTKEATQDHRGVDTWASLEHAYPGWLFITAEESAKKYSLSSMNSTLIMDGKPL